MTQTPELFAGLAAPAAFDPESVIEDLGEGLVLRAARAQDCDAVAEFNRVVHANAPDYTPLDGIAAWTRDLFSGHPRVRPSDFVLVHDTKADRIAATLMLIPHRFRYGSVEVEAGQPELVGSHPSYRRRGLIRRMFDEVHGWSAERGQKLQVIGGIAGYYRQFGYDMAIEHGVSYRAVRDAMPAGPGELEDGTRVRPATVDDIPLLASLYEQSCARQRLSCTRDERQWRYELEGHRPDSEMAFELRVVEREGAPAAVFGHRNLLRGGRLEVVCFDVVPGVPRQAITGPFLAALRRAGDEYAERDGQSFEGASFYLGRDHPLYELARGRVMPGPRPYALYLRVPDLVDFLTHVAPELDRRLAASSFAGQRGTLDLNLFRTGVRIAFDNGRITGVESWLPDQGANGHVSFPELSFLHLLSGHRSLAELQAFHADCLVFNEGRAALVEALFPPQPSWFWSTL